MRFEQRGRLASKWKQSGSSVARRRLARNPKLRMRMKAAWQQVEQEAAWLRSRCKVAAEREPILVEGGLQSGDELAAKNLAEDLDRQEKSGA